MDASTLLNPANGGVLELALAIPGTTFFVSSEVRRESRTINALVTQLNELGLLHFIDDDAISADELETAMTNWDLGAGECECILAARPDSSRIACDDQSARARIDAELGEDRKWGSLGILKSAVDACLLTADEAYAAYQRMRDAGGFLPDMTPEYFGAPA